MLVEDVLECHICHTKRRRNLIVSYPVRKGESVLWGLVLDLEQAFRDGHLDRHVICHRCKSLNLSSDDLRYTKDWYFPDQNYRYKDLEQKKQANAARREGATW